MPPRGLARFVVRVDAAPRDREVDAAPARRPLVPCLEIVERGRVDEAARDTERVLDERCPGVERASRGLVADAPLVVEILYPRADVDGLLSYVIVVGLVDVEVAVIGIRLTIPVAVRFAVDRRGRPTTRRGRIRKRTTGERQQS